MKTGDGNTEEREAAATGDRDAVRGHAGAAGASAAKNRRSRESYDLIEDLYCGDNGRPCCDPVVLFKLMLIQYISKAPPHNSAMRQAMPFPPSAACKFLDLPPVNPRNLHLHLTKNPFAGRPPHLCGVALNPFAAANRAGRRRECGVSPLSGVCDVTEAAALCDDPLRVPPSLYGGGDRKRIPLDTGGGRPGGISVAGCRVRERDAHQGERDPEKAREKGAPAAAKRYQGQLAGRTLYTHDRQSDLRARRSA